MAKPKMNYSSISNKLICSSSRYNESECVATGSLSLEVPHKQFDNWNGWISRFIWNSRGQQKKKKADEEELPWLV